MQEKSKKVLKRVGAAVLLGLSFLNFGSSWGGQRAKSTPRRAQNIRKETQEEVDSEVKEIADIAEKEAADVINQEMQQQEQRQEMQQQAQTRTQATLKYAAVGGWGIAMAVFFTSAIFNQPFDLGKAVLSLLPGEPHVAMLTVGGEKNSWQVGENVEVNIQLATNEEKVNYFKTTVIYESEFLELQKMDIDKNKFNIVEENKVDQKNGVIAIVARKTGEGNNLKKDIIAKLTFKALKKSDKVNIKLDQTKSLVIKTKKEDNKGYNILGKVKGFNFRIVRKVEQAMNCMQIDVVQSRMDKQQWEWLVNSAPIPLEGGNNWVDITDETSLLCAYSEDGSIYILAYSDKKIEELEIMNTATGSKIEIIKIDEWRVSEGNFYAVIIDGNKMVKELPNKFRNIVISFNTGEEKQRWPEKNAGEIILQTSADNR
jgi:hypothetical protein